jgi:hypothetical protein
MAVLLTLTVVSLRSSQAHARDEERKTDVAIIAQNLENYYRVGSDPDTAASPSQSFATLASSTMPSIKLAAAVAPPKYVLGNYPPTAYFVNETEIKSALRDIDPTALRAPGVAESSPPSLIAATSASTTQSPNTSTYIYQPLKADGSLCTTGQTSTFTETIDKCRKFNLYYHLETVSGVQTITSKNQ